MIPAYRTGRATDNYIASCGGAGASDTQGWQRELALASITPSSLLQRLGLVENADLATAMEDALQPGFPLRVTESFIRRMQPGDPHDPLLRQVLPLRAESATADGFSSDPLREGEFNVAPGLIKKYSSRALLLVSQACAIHCRYCFRKDFPYRDNLRGTDDWSGTLAPIAADSEVNEIILSGGDPLTATDKALAKLLAQVSRIPHISTLRIHSRLPVVLPSRITPELVRVLSRWRGKLVVVIHSNHAAELDASVGKALAALAGAGAFLLNQAVLLRGVNDSSHAQIALSRTLFEYGVLPYYLHQLDKVSGTSHFEVSDARARKIHGAMRAALPGYLLPRLVRELPGEVAKTPVF